MAALRRGVGDWHLNIIDVSVHDNVNQQLLYVVDYSTKFTVLHSAPNKINLLKELKKIFVYYGVPETVYVPRALLNVEDVVNALWNEDQDTIKPDVILEENSDIYRSYEEEIMRQIRAWSLNSEDILPVGCSIVQFFLNTKLENVPHEHDMILPMQLFYKRKEENEPVEEPPASPSEMSIIVQASPEASVAVQVEEAPAGNEPAVPPNVSNMRMIRDIFFRNLRSTTNIDCMSVLLFILFLVLYVFYQSLVYIMLAFSIIVMWASWHTCVIQYNERPADE